jgi:hypothetical protein
MSSRRILSSVSCAVCCSIWLTLSVSAGFDAAEGDALGQCLVTPPAYGHMTHMLCALAGGKVVVALEVSSEKPV